jgi:hypothetical protein
MKSATLTNFFLPKVHSQMMCQSWMRFTTLENVSPSYGITTHYLGTTFEENFDSIAFSHCN